jgi:hypothetical protein
MFYFYTVWQRSISARLEMTSAPIYTLISLGKLTSRIDFDMSAHFTVSRLFVRTFTFTVYILVHYNKTKNDHKSPGYPF